jgi:uncharacterized protein YifN (PemK superfamily)
VKKPNPEVGQIIKYDYLWRDEQQRGKIEGSKERPCAVIVAIQSQNDGSYTVLLAPITHSSKQANNASILIPRQAKKITGLDEDQSWLLTTEVNAVSWLDPGILPAKKGQWLYGYLPRGIAKKAVEDILKFRGEKKLKIIDRRDHMD